MSTGQWCLNIARSCPPIRYSVVDVNGIPPPNERRSSRLLLRLSACWLLTGTVLSCTAWGQTQHSADNNPAQLAEALEHRLVNEVYPILDESCMGCHGPRRSKGDVRFHKMDTLSAAMEKLDTLLLAHDLLSTHEMPPDDEPQPTDEQRAVLLDWIDDLNTYALATQGIDPGWFSTRRLNNDEYRLTMRDLLGIDPSQVDLAQWLPADDLGYGFNTVGDALTLSTLHVEEYLASAERALEVALGPEIVLKPQPRTLGPIEGSRNSNALDAGGRHLYSDGFARVQTDLPASSMYEIFVTAWGDRGGPDLPRLSLRIDGKELQAWSVRAENEIEAQRFSVVVELDKGPHTIAGYFTNDFYIKGKADRNLAIAMFEIAGPLDARSSHREGVWPEIFFVEPDSGDASHRQAAEAILERFAARAFRRPMVDGEIERLMTVYDSSREAGDSYESAVRLGLQAVLVSPRFLFLSVENPRADDPATTYILGGHELATRLSYFLWSSMPDAELGRLADLDLLREPRVLRSQVRRMLADPKAQAFIEGFAGQWLLLRNLEDLEIDRERFSGYDDSLVSSMTQEAFLFFADVVRSNRPIMDLVNARDVFINQQLAKHYGIEGVRGTRLRRVQLNEDSPRGGVLTMGAVLTVTSNPTRTSPVKRGLFVLDQLLGSPPPPPPSDVPPLEQTSTTLDPNASLREQLAAHLLNPDCASCHVRMDPIGLSMEQFDAVGRWRSDADSASMDVSAELPGGITFEGPRELKEVLLAQAPDITENITRRLMIYAFGRGLEAFDRPTVAAIMEQTAEEGNGFTDLIEAVVVSEAFTTCRGREQRK